jgi:hypothetical protein
MSAPLYEPCVICDGTGMPRAEAVLCSDPQARAIELLGAGLCPGCEGRRYLPIGLTAGQVKALVREHNLRLAGPAGAAQAEYDRLASADTLAECRARIAELTRERDEAITARDLQRSRSLDLIKANTELGLGLVELLTAAGTLVERYRRLMTAGGAACPLLPAIESEVDAIDAAASPGQGPMGTLDLLRTHIRAAEGLGRQRAALRSLVQRAKDGGIDDDWRREARCVLRATGPAGQGPGEAP